jgi:hypothetical protein
MPQITGNFTATTSDRAQGCGVKRDTGALARLVASLTLTMTRALGILA